MLRCPHTPFCIPSLFTVRLSLLVPCWNEASSIRRSAESWLNQTRPFDEIIVVDDASTDGTGEILQSFGSRITVLRTPRNLGNKSYAQEVGLSRVTGDVFVTTDGDTLLHPDFAKEIETCFDDPEVAAAGGYVRSLHHNWITRHRAFEYVIGQNFHKVAQSYLSSLFVIPGAAGAFRTDIFRQSLTFDHDTIAEDLDFTYKLHSQGHRIAYNRNAVVYTQDPATLESYMNQMRRWMGGGWQNLQKNYHTVERPAHALVLALLYGEGLVFSSLLFLLPLLNLRLAGFVLVPYLIVAAVLSTYAAVKERRSDLVFAYIPYLLFIYINAYVFLEQFLLEVVLQRKQLRWFTPERTGLA